MPHPLAVPACSWWPIVATCGLQLLIWRASSSACQRLDRLRRQLRDDGWRI